MKILNDKEIRYALLGKLARSSKKPIATLEEVHVCNGNAIADVVAVYKSMHCYEIKGETDSVSRIVHQSQFYDVAFPLITLVTTVNHIKKAEKIAPSHWGLILAKADSSDSIVFKHVRGASNNPMYRPEVALLSLWRAELINIAYSFSVSVEKMNRQKMAELIASKATTKVINDSLGRVLAARRMHGPILDSPAPCM